MGVDPRRRVQHPRQAHRFDGQGVITLGDLNLQLSDQLRPRKDLLRRGRWRIVIGDAFFNWLGAGGPSLAPSLRVGVDFGLVRPIRCARW